jgi:hypothetical protein
MPVKIKAGLDSKRLEDKLKILFSGLGNINKELLSGVGKLMAEEARGKAGGAFTSRTGKLLRAIKFLPMENGIVFTTRNSLKKSNAFYANMVEHGIASKPKKKKYLTFKINGEWKKVRNVRTNPRPFMNPVFDEYWNDGGNSKAYQILAGALKNRIEKELE